MSHKSLKSMSLESLKSMSLKSLKSMSLKSLNPPQASEGSPELGPRPVSSSESRTSAEYRGTSLNSPEFAPHAWISHENLVSGQGSWPTRNSHGRPQPWDSQGRPQSWESRPAMGISSPVPSSRGSGRSPASAVGVGRSPAAAVGGGRPGSRTGSHTGSAMSVEGAATLQRTLDNFNRSRTTRV